MRYQILIWQKKENYIHTLNITFVVASSMFKLVTVKSASPKPLSYIVDTPAFP